MADNSLNFVLTISLCEGPAGPAEFIFAFSIDGFRGTMEANAGRFRSIAMEQLERNFGLNAIGRSAT
jgi:hypothetical protein